MDATASIPARSHNFGRFLADFRVPMSFVLIMTVIVMEFVFGRPGILPAATLLSAPYWGIGFVLLGLFIRSWAAGVLRKGKSLATHGPYSLVRHPLYLGSGLMMLGFCHLTCDPLFYVPMLGAMVIIYCNTMRCEERRLAEHFPEAWPNYAARTPMLLPWKPMRFASEHWTLAQWKKNREYQAAATVLISLALLGVWRLLEMNELIGKL
ncbi:MAG: hypothetical protein C0483_18320 [Pirellula sp.]|nr:hypothetical protein [Pirellula sp.]